MEEIVCLSAGTARHCTGVVDAVHNPQYGEWTHDIDADTCSCGRPNAVRNLVSNRSSDGANERAAWRIMLAEVAFCLRIAPLSVAPRGAAQRFMMSMVNQITSETA